MKTRMVDILPMTIPDNCMTEAIVDKTTKDVFGKHCNIYARLDMNH